MFSIRYSVRINRVIEAKIPCKDSHIDLRVPLLQRILKSGKSSVQGNTGRKIE